MERKRIAQAPQRLDRLYGAVDNERIEPAVVVDVEPGRSKAGVGAACRAKTGARALFLEQADPVVDVQVVAFTGEIRDEQIVVSVVVEIAGIDTHAGFGFAVRAQGRARQEA